VAFVDEYGNRIQAPKKKKKRRPIQTAPPARPNGPGRITSVVPFKAIAAKSQAGKPLNLKDLQYMQKLAWTTVKQGQDAELQQAISIARDWIQGLRDKARISMTDARGEEVKVRGMGLDYRAYHKRGETQPSNAYQKVLDSYAEAEGRALLA